MGQIKDLAGQRFGRLTVLKFVGLQKRYAWWKCKCDCGETVDSVRGNRLISGSTRSCGCLQIELASALGSTSGGHNATHRMVHSPEYHSWCALRQRCSNPNRRAYHRYGGRGIKVCNWWNGPNGFENFLADMGRKPGPQYWIDRINNDGDYAPDNCRWATAKEQNNNRSNNLRMEARGV